MTNKIVGIDSARWQSEVPWTDVAASGVAFAWIKVVHGLSRVPDPEFARSWRNSRGALRYGRGGYSWLTDGDPGAQAENLVRMLEGTGDIGELYPTVDWEEPGTVHRGEALVLHALRALRRVRELVGGVVLYTGAWYVRQYVAPDNTIEQIVSRELLDELCGYPLWHAEYPRIELRNRRACATDPFVIPPPHIGRIWTNRGVSLAVHQFDGNGGCVLPNGVDADFNVATREGLARALRVPSPSMAPDTMPETPTGKSTPRMTAVREPIADLSGGPATPLRAGEGEHTVELDDVDLD